MSNRGHATGVTQPGSHTMTLVFKNIITVQEIFKVIIREGEDVNTCRAWMNMYPMDMKEFCDHDNLLFFAFVNSTVDVLKLLLDTGANPNLCYIYPYSNEMRRSVLHRFCQNRIRDDWIDKIAVLLEAGADPNTHDTDSYPDASTPLYELIRLNTGFIEKYCAIEMLLKAGANPNALCDFMDRPLLDVVCSTDAGLRSNDITFLFLRYGATSEDYPSMINNVFIICNIMLYGMGLPNNWCREIKECIY